MRDNAHDAEGDCSIRVRAIRKTYATGRNRVQALRGIDLDISEPGFYAIMGPSGSGKTTLLHLLAALDRPDPVHGSEIVVAGQRLNGMTERELTLFRRRRIGIIFQQFNLISTLNAIDNVTLPAMLDGRPQSWRTKRGEELLDTLGLLDRAHHRPDALSGGEQQRVAIARALLFSPAVLFADEPTGNLDSTTSARMWSLLKQLAAERRMTVLMVTHEPSAAEHCRRVFVLRDGVIEKTLDMNGDHAAEPPSRTQQPVG
ncbi:MAG TPA: ABC transporter ATP-binding protein [Phycisphaerales bacterium]|nr:ABC transporter ATP-binding protein [Phycisphaerales bacterium]